MDKNDLKLKYDIGFEDECSVEIPKLEDLTGIILIVGSSGSGKSTILKSLKHKEYILNNDLDVIDNFSNLQSGEKLLLSFGLRTIPTWFRSIDTLSNGERHRAEIAFAIDNGSKTIDEFTSVVDRYTAKSLSSSIRKWFDSSEINKLFIASCHHDIVDWLQPDWIYDTDSKLLRNRRVERRPEIKIRIESSNYKDWEIFKRYHYLSSKMSKATHSYTAYLDDKPIAFLSVIHGCNRDIHSFWRECRTVVLPEFQGLGIGSILSNTIAELYVSNGFRYFCKTAHPALGEHRNKSPLWRATSTNGQARKSYLNKDGSVRESKGYGKTEKEKIRDAYRVCYSHEYIGCQMTLKDEVEY